jgi:hypothetical protein
VKRAREYEALDLRGRARASVLIKRKLRDL